jgi:phosphoglycerate dehydrogenase-like enzyme
MSGPLAVVVATELVEPVDVEELRLRLGSGASVTHLPLPWRDAGEQPAPLLDGWDAVLRDAHVVVGFAQQLPALPAAAPRLGLVQHGGAGIDAVDVGAFERAGIGLVTAAGIGARSVGDFAVAALLALALRHPERAEAQRARRWERFPTAELGDLRLLVVGAGPVGQRVCEVAAALGMAVTAARRRPELGAPTGAVAVVGLGALHEALPAADAVVVAIALGEATRGLIGAEELALLPAGALVVNVARGAIVDEAAIEAALAARRLGGAWLDVFAREPLPPANSLWDAPNLRVSAHDATATIGYSRRLARRAGDSVVAWRAGRPVPHAIVAPSAPPQEPR